MRAEGRRTARLEAIAVVHAIQENRPEDAEVMVAGSDDPLELARAACALVSAIITVTGLPAATILGGMATAATLEAE